MNPVSDILLMKGHRPYPMPERPWKYYQEWHDVLFAHWKVPLPIIRDLVPSGIDIDLFDGEAWVSLVAFTVKKLRPHILPSFFAISDFYEINLRTYVVRNHKSGIYFFSLEAHKTASALLARIATGLPYLKSTIHHSPCSFESFNNQHQFYLEINYRPGDNIVVKSALDKWLTERYCLFLERDGKIVGNDIHHFEWPLKRVEIEKLELNYQYHQLIIDGEADLYHYSPGVYVPTWGQVPQ